jgi:hypothetical protein
MASPQPLVYLVLGSSGSGRCALLADLIDGGLDDSASPVVLLPAGKPPGPGEETLPDASRWEWREGALSAAFPPGASHVFFVADGAANPVDLVEAFKPWLEAQGAALARVLCVVDCRLASRHPPLLAWFEACIHFSDVVLLNHREGVENKWLSDFLGRFKGQYLPCLFENVKDGRVKNPALILEPEARRMSHVFDAGQEWIFTDADGEVIDDEDEAGDGEEEIEAAPAVDPYFARDAAGRRVKRLPDISRYLGPVASDG